MDRVDPRIAEEMKKLGAFDLNACYSCGHCSAPGTGRLKAKP